MLPYSFAPDSGSKRKVFPPKDYCTCAKTPSPLKNYGKIVSWDYEIPNWMENQNPFMFQSTNQLCSIEIVDLPINSMVIFPSVMFQSTNQKSCCYPGFRLWDGHFGAVSSFTWTGPTMGTTRTILAIGWLPFWLVNVAMESHFYILL